MRSLNKAIIFTCLFTMCAPFSVAEDGLKAIVETGQARLTENQNAQKTISKTHEASIDMLERYQTLLKTVDGLKIYNKILAKQLDDQAQQMNGLDTSIAQAAVLERQILPLLARMLDSLEKFIVLDTPFLKEERQARVSQLRTLIYSSNLTNAEKTRRVFEAFQIENDYGHTIETYKGKLNLSNSSFDVDFLRIGRVALCYRTVGKQHYGYWDPTQEAWVMLEASLYKRNIDKGIKMAKQEMAPELLTFPLPLASVTSR